MKSKSFNRIDVRQIYHLISVESPKRANLKIFKATTPLGNLKKLFKADRQDVDVEETLVCAENSPGPSTRIILKAYCLDRDLHLWLWKRCGDKVALWGPKV